MRVPPSFYSNTFPGGMALLLMFSSITPVSRWESD
jgi:hypothetical protein